MSSASHFGWKRKMQRTRRTINSVLKAKIALEALRGQKSVADLAQQYGLHPNQIYAWKKQLQNYAVLAFDRPTRQIVQLQAKVSRGDSTKPDTQRFDGKRPWLTR
jgi:transposase-like protein